MEFGDREWKREKEEWKRRDRGRENQTDSQRRKRGIRITDALQIYMVSDSKMPLLFKLNV